MPRFAMFVERGWSAVPAVARLILLVAVIVAIVLFSASAVVAGHGNEPAPFRWS